MPHPEFDLLGADALTYWAELQSTRDRARKIDTELTSLLIEINTREASHEKRLAVGQSVSRQEREELADLRQQADDLRIIKARLPDLIEQQRSRYLRVAT